MFRFMLAAAILAAAFALLLPGCETPANLARDRQGAIVYKSIPRDVLPQDPQDEAQLNRLSGWLETHVMGDDDVPEGDDDTPDKTCGNMGPTYCRDVTSNLSFCTDACGEHHYLTPSGCYDSMSGERVECH